MFHLLIWRIIVDVDNTKVTVVATVLPGKQKRYAYVLCFMLTRHMCNIQHKILINFKT